MSIVEKIEEGIESGVKAVEKFFTGEAEDVKGEVEGAADTVEQAGEKVAEDAAGAVEGEAGNVAKAVESESTQADATGATAESKPVDGAGTAPAA
jgi:hypothetical protein